MKIISISNLRIVPNGTLMKYMLRIFVLYFFSIVFKSFDTSFSHELSAFSERGQYFSLLFVFYGFLAWELAVLLAHHTELYFKHLGLQVRLTLMGMVLLVYGAMVSVLFGIIYKQFDIIFFDRGFIWNEMNYLDYDLNAGLFIHYLLMLTIAGLNYYHKNWRASELQTERLLKENIQAKFDALRHQIDPHFFFNSLSVLTNLVHKDAGVSAQYINHLAKMYRYILDKKFQNMVSLASELEFIEAYIFLINIRHQQNIHITITLSDELCSNGYLPPATLQILLENAIKHNCFTKAHPLQIQINEIVMGETERGIRIKNNLNIRKLVVASTGLGLENIKNRYELLCGKAINIHKTDTSFEVLVPIICS